METINKNSIVFVHKRQIFNFSHYSSGYNYRGDKSACPVARRLLPRRTKGQKELQRIYRQGV